MRFTPPTACTFSTSGRHLEVQKWSQPVVCLNMFTSKRASRHNGVHFFESSTSKRGPNMVCFVHFDFHISFAPQRRALFRTAQRPTCFYFTFHFKMLFTPQRRAIFHLSSGHVAPHPLLLRAYFSTLPEPLITGKTQCFTTFLPLRTPASSLLTFSLSDLLHLLSSPFWLLLPCLPLLPVHIVGSLASKLPSNKCDLQVVCWWLFLSDGNIHLNEEIPLTTYQNWRTSSTLLQGLVWRETDIPGPNGSCEQRNIQRLSLMSQNPMCVLSSENQE